MQFVKGNRGGLIRQVSVEDASGLGVPTTFQSSASFTSSLKAGLKCL